MIIDGHRSPTQRSHPWRQICLSHGPTSAPRSQQPGEARERNRSTMLLMGTRPGERLHFAMENGHFIAGKIHYKSINGKMAMLLMGKSTINDYKWAIFNCYVNVHQRVNQVFRLGHLKNSYVKRI